MTKDQAEALYTFVQRFKSEKPLYTLRSEPSMMPYVYGNAIEDFITCWFSCQESKCRYDDIVPAFNENYKNQHWLTSLSVEEVCMAIQYIIRTDRFVDGHINAMIENNTLPLLLTRLKELYA